MSRNLGVPYTDKKPYYFISYNSEDEAVVSKYAAALTKFGFGIWYDNGILIGKPWELEIVEKMENSEAVIMFFSKSIFSKEKSYVYREFELATKHFNKDVYIVMLDEVKETEVPNRFKMWWISITGLQCIYSFEYKSPEECIRVLHENIKASSRTAATTEKNHSDQNPDPSEPREEKSNDKQMEKYKSFSHRLGFFAMIFTTLLSFCVNFIEITGFVMTQCYACIFFLGFMGVYLLFWSKGNYRGIRGLCELFVLSFIGSTVLSFGGYAIYVVFNVTMNIWSSILP